MIYLSSFLFSQVTVSNPNIYPYSVFEKMEERLLVFRPITVLYGNNALGKFTMLNIIANKLGLEGQEYGRVFYFSQFVEECCYTVGDDEEGRPIRKIPKHSRYLKSEDVLYEIKKIQQQLECLKFAQEKYSNGETTLQLLEDYLEPDGLYLLDEPEVSLSLANQAVLAEKLNYLTRFLGCQFIIATHSPFMLGTLNAKIYNLDSKELEEARWTELENVRYFYEFFERHRKEFE